MLDRLSNRLLLVCALVVGLGCVTAHGQITVPYPAFQAGTVISSTEVNSNFAMFANALNRTGGTMTGSVLFSPDATHDIGASGASRPRDLFLSRNLVVGAALTVGGAITASGGVIGALTGNVTGNVSGSAATFTGALAGDVTGTMGATIVGDDSHSHSDATLTSLSASKVSGTFASVTSTGDIVTSGYVKLANTAPPSGDCDDTTEIGRMVIAYSAGANSLYICGGAPNPTKAAWHTITW